MHVTDFKFHDFVDGQLKAWAKAYNVNDSKKGTLNSLSIILLAALHLQVFLTKPCRPVSYIKLLILFQVADYI